MQYYATIDRESANDSSYHTALRERLLSVGVTLLVPSTTRQIAYETAVVEFEKIKNANLHISNAQTLSKEQLHKIMCSMLNSKPIVLTKLPHLEESVNPFLKDIFFKRLSKILICDLMILDQIDLLSFLKNSISQSVKYSLTKQEQALISASLEDYFIELHKR